MVGGGIPGGMLVGKDDPMGVPEVLGYSLEYSSPGLGGPAARQLIYLAVAAVAFGVAAAVDYHVWAEFSWLLYGGAMALKVA